MQPFDQAWFSTWHTRQQHLLDDLMLTQRIGNKEIISCAVKAWREMFPLDDKGNVIPNRALSKAFFDAGIVPFCRTAIPDSVFMPAEAERKALAAARARCHIPNPSPEEAHALIDRVSPAAPPVHVDIEAATRIARKSRKKVSEILTGHEVRARKAADILAKAAEEAEKQRKREARVANRLARGAQAAERARARSAKAAFLASRPPTKKRTPKLTAAAKAVVPIGDGIVAEPIAGAKRRAETSAPLGGTVGSEAVPPTPQKRVRLVLHERA